MQPSVAELSCTETFILVLLTYMSILVIRVIFGNLPLQMERKRQHICIVFYDILHIVFLHRNWLI